MKLGMDQLLKFIPHQVEELEIDQLLKLILNLQVQLVQRRKFKADQLLEETGLPICCIRNGSITEIGTDLNNC